MQIEPCVPSQVSEPQAAGGGRRPSMVTPKSPARSLRASRANLGCSPSLPCAEGGTLDCGPTDPAYRRQAHAQGYMAAGKMISNLRLVALYCSEHVCAVRTFREDPRTKRVEPYIAFCRRFKLPYTRPANIDVEIHVDQYPLRVYLWSQSGYRTTAGSRAL